MYNRVKILGLQRSGTNWLTALIKTNLDIEVYEDPLLPFFKHALPNENKIPVKLDGETIITRVPFTYIMEHPDELFILVYKSPSMWINSIRRKKVDLQQKRPRLFDNRNRLSEQKARTYWMKYMYRWMDLPFQNMVIVSYISVLANFEAFLINLNINHKIPAKVSTWVNVDKVEHSQLFTETDRNRYLNY